MSKRIITMLVVVGLVAVVALAGSCDKLKAIPGNIAGQLLNDAGQGQGFIAVQLVEVESGKIVASETADDSGNYMFKGIDAGTYNIKTVPIGGDERRNNCEEFRLAPGKTLTVDIIVYKDE